MKEVVVTTSWDDGHVLDIRLSALLMKYGVRGTFYISPEDRQISIGSRLTKEQIRTLSSRFEIGAHTMTHPNLRTLSDTEAQQEIAQSKTWLEAVIQKPVTSFCYPSGYFTERDERLVKKTGFSLARTVARFATSVGNNPFRLPTTLHAYDHWLDAWQVLVFARFNPVTFARYYMHWDVLAKAMFDRVSATGGVFHLWGHSWEVDARGDWQRLESVLEYIGSKPSVVYKTNAELI